MADLEKKAKEAFIDDHFELAVDLYTQAIALDPTNPDLFADRAQANIKLNKFTEAVADASKAIELDASLAKAYLRKRKMVESKIIVSAIIACMKVGKYENAKAALEAGTSLVPGESRFTNLIKECDELIAEETGESKNHAADAQVNIVSRKDAVPEDTSSQAPMVIPSKPKYRHEFYQKPEEVVVSIFAKGIQASWVTVDFGEQTLSVSFEVPGEDGYHFQPRLFGKIKPDECKYNILSTKVEFRLAKAEPGLHWASLEYNKQTAVVQRIAVSSEIAQKPTYPSSKPKRVDWDKIEAQVKKEEKEEKLDGDAALNSFFRGIYQDADEDTRRAMKKSFVESNGTVLSTNWKEVGTKKVEGSPPDGMEMRKWEY
ncbi:PHOSPHATASE-RELATED [Salix koriyanagi]|uniref:Protein SGT1 homolog n=1 Tax=Salix koriyanagi TaxID=2511006 RepID=A0A9Q0VPJ6_9ROSI|nr:PHOSPHATASE-RELATED [Salix koriyanagi]